MEEAKIIDTDQSWTIEALADSLEYEIIDAAETFATQEGEAHERNAGGR